MCFGNWDVNGHGICQISVGSFKCYCVIWFHITLASLPSAVRMHILNRGYSIRLRPWMVRFELLSHVEPRWVKQSWSWSTALIWCETEINICCCKSLRFWLFITIAKLNIHKKDFYAMRRKFIVISAFTSALFYY